MFMDQIFKLSIKLHNFWYMLAMKLINEWKYLFRYTQQEKMQSEAINSVNSWLLNLPMIIMNQMGSSTAMHFSLWYWYIWSAIGVDMQLIPKLTMARIGEENKACKIYSTRDNSITTPIDSNIFCAHKQIHWNSSALSLFLILSVLHIDSNNLHSFTSRNRKEK